VVDKLVAPPHFFKSMAREFLSINSLQIGWVVCRHESEVCICFSFLCGLRHDLRARIVVWHFAGRAVFPRWSPGIICFLFEWIIARPCRMLYPGSIGSHRSNAVGNEHDKKRELRR
jgi:hypothetical protein